MIKKNILTTINYYLKAYYSNKKNLPDDPHQEILDIFRQRKLKNNPGAFTLV